jgi:tol-pal system protein YbgF
MRDVSTSKIAIMIRKHIRAAAFVFAAFAVAGWPAMAPAQQMDDSDVVVRLDQLQNQVRQLTGSIEQLQYRNQQLEQQMKRMQDDTEFRFQELSKGGARPSAQAARPQPGAIAQPPMNQAASPAAQLPPPQQQQLPQGGGGRGDAFDPGQNPNAPGVPRQLGTGRRSDIMQSNGAMAANGGPASIVSEEQQIGAPGGREPGAPLDITNMPRSASAGDAQQGYPQQQGYQQQGYPQRAAPLAPPQGATAALSPAQTTRDQYDAAYSYMLRKDYASAEQNLRAFMTQHPRDKLSGDAQFWIGESQFQRQDYRAAAESFVAMSKKYENHAKAPDALLRLGQSLAALKDKDLACATFSEVGRKYPRASQSVKQTIEREQKRVGC